MIKFSSLNLSIIAQPITNHCKINWIFIKVLEIVQ